MRFGINNIPTVVKNLLIINILGFILVQFLESRYPGLEKMLAIRYIFSHEFRPYQLVTHMFVHANIGHLFGNMLGLWVFGGMLENVWGAKRFLIFYFVTGIGACMFDQVYLYFSLAPQINLYQHIYDTQPLYASDALEAINFVKDQYSARGASGAIYGLIMGAALLFPNTEIYLYFAIPVKLKYLAIFYGLSEVYLALQTAEGDNVAHLVHLGGMVFSFILIRLWRRDRSKFY